MRAASAAPAAGQTEVDRLVNMALIWVPRAAMAPMQTTAMRASSRPYSASVAPSSLRVTNLAKNLRAAVMCFTATVSWVRKGSDAGCQRCPGRRSDGGGQAGEHGADLGAEDGDGADADDGDEGQQQAVLGQRGALLAAGDELGEELA